jgi:hypothetical protein
MGKASEPGTTYLCGTHGRLTVPVWQEGEKRMRHSTAGDGDWCFSQRYTRRVVEEVDRAEVLASLNETGEGS